MVLNTEVYAKISFRNLCKGLKEEVLDKFPKTVPTLNPVNTEVQKRLKPLLKEIFHLDWQKVFEIDFDNKVVKIDKHILNIKTDKAQTIKHLTKIFNSFKKYNIELKNTRSQHSINKIQTVDDLTKLLSQCEDFKFEIVSNGIITTPTVQKFSLEAKQKLELEEALDTTYMFCHISSVRSSKKIINWITKYRKELPMFVNNVKILEETGSLFCLNAFLLPKLMKVFMEVDKENELPILFDDAEIGKDDELIGKLDVFLDNNVKQLDSKEKGKDYIIIDSYSLVCNDYNILDCYTYPVTDIKQIMYHNFIPKTSYNAFNTRVVIEQAKRFPLKYKDFSSRKIALEENGHRYIVFENAHDIQRTYLAQKKLNPDRK